MQPRRSTERLIGVTFIVATLSSSLGFVLLDPILDDPDLLGRVAADEASVMFGASLLLVNAIAVVVIAALLYPILIDHDPPLTRLYAAARVAESVVLVMGIVGVLSLVTLSDDHPPPDTDAASYRASADSLLAIHEWGVLLGILLFFGLAALLLNTVLLRARLIPPWLAIWGLIGAVLLLIEGAFESAGAEGLEVLSAPIAVQEMVFAGWLIVRGFAPDQIERPADSQYSSLSSRL